jgi:hypothetical protein
MNRKGDEAAQRLLFVKSFVRLFRLRGYLTTIKSAKSPRLLKNEINCNIPQDDDANATT